MKEGMRSSHQSLLTVFVCAAVLQFGSAFVGPTTARFMSCSAGAEHLISRSSLATRPLPPRRQRVARQIPGRGLNLGSLRMAKKWTGGPGPLPPGPSNNLGKGPEKDGGGRKKGGKEGEEQESGLEDHRLYSVRIARSTGIDWGTDISFSWVFVRDLQPSGAAALSGEVSIGDQLIAINDVNTIGCPFDFAMDTMIGLKGPEVEFTFFRGTKDELKDAVGAEDPPAEITVTVLQQGKEDVTLKAPSGANLRNLLTDNKINVYQSVTRWTNCKGKQLCGTCIVDINKGLDDCTIRSIDESSTLRDNPATYRLSCVTDMYDDVTVTVFPPVGAAQWTR